MQLNRGSMVDICGHGLLTVSRSRLPQRLILGNLRSSFWLLPFTELHVLVSNSALDFRASTILKMVSQDSNISLAWNLVKSCRCVLFNIVFCYSRSSFPVPSTIFRGSVAGTSRFTLVHLSPPRCYSPLCQVIYSAHRGHSDAFARTY